MGPLSKVCCRESWLFMSKKSVVSPSLSAKKIYHRSDSVIPQTQQNLYTLSSAQQHKREKQTKDGDYLKGFDWIAAGHLSKIHMHLEVKLMKPKKWAKSCWKPWRPCWSMQLNFNLYAPKLIYVPGVRCYMAQSNYRNKTWFIWHYFGLIYSHIIMDALYVKE